MASNRIGKETIETEHGKSQITFYGNSFIAGQSFLEAFSTIVQLDVLLFGYFLINFESEMFFDRPYWRDCCLC